MASTGYLSYYGAKPKIQTKILSRSPNTFNERIKSITLYMYVNKHPNINLEFFLMKKVCKILEYNY